MFNDDATTEVADNDGVPAPIEVNEDFGLERLSGASRSEGDKDRAREEDAIEEDIEGGRDVGEVCPPPPPLLGSG